MSVFILVSASCSTLAPVPDGSFCAGNEDRLVCVCNEKLSEGETSALY